MKAYSSYDSVNGIYSISQAVLVRILSFPANIRKKLILDYDKFVKDVGIVIPSGSAEAFQTVDEKSA